MKTLLKWAVVLLLTLVLVVTALFFALRLQPSSDTSHLAAVALSHRGFSASTPENTLASIRAAKASGAEAIEIDVGVTADGDFMLMHDCTVDRTTNGAGRLSELTTAVVKALQVDSLEGYPPQPVPELKEALLLAKELGLMVELDLKEDAQAKPLMAWLDPFLAEHDLYKQVWVASFWPQKLYRVRKINPKIITALLLHPKPTDNTFINGLLRTSLMPRFLGVGLVRPHSDVVKADDQFLARYAKLGMVVNTWVINTEAEHQWLQSIGHKAYSTDCYGSFCEPFVVAGHEHSGLCPKG